MMELRYIIGMFLWQFDAGFAVADQEEPYYKDAFVVLRGPLSVKLNRRFG